MPVRAGFPNSATGLDLGFYAARSYSSMRPPRKRLDSLSCTPAAGSFVLAEGCHLAGLLPGLVVGGGPGQVPAT